jgi:hypothetical protein
MKRPSFQFYPGDWLNDAALRMVSVSARGLWVEMICIMHQGSDYGHLKVNHKVILTVNLSRMIGATLLETEGWLKELLDAGVYSVSGDGCIFSRRMIRDEEVREARAAGGFLGGNPALLGKNKVNLTANLQPTPSSSSSSSSSSSTILKPKIKNNYAPPISDALLSAWMEVRKAKRAGKVTELVWKGIEREAALARTTTDQAVQICIERGWQGFKAEWLEKNNSGKGNIHDERAKTIAALTGRDRQQPKTFTSEGFASKLD